MPCDSCHPDVVDYGFEMSDVRETRYVNDSTGRMTANLPIASLS
jgi:hypothetical protein